MIRNTQHPKHIRHNNNSNSTPFRTCRKQHFNGYTNSIKPVNIYISKTYNWSWMRNSSISYQLHLGFYNHMPIVWNSSYFKYHTYYRGDIKWR